ncbi:ribosomal RNA-processing protein 7 homolog A [Achroia grisella]|uniref:ribosomal RNA-processing protein 7 homolog A n=1 Tax=Achroia grisella TaxID=688607 RepID=UPI0027D29195|nr:ribosomal RNA-processing protein 7 homolog A [Achroia grisella]
MKLNIENRNKIKTMKTPKHIKHEFKALELKLTEDSTSPHTIYLKEHAVRDHTKDKPSGRTLLILNIPPYADEKGIENAFKEAGDIESVQFLLKPSGADNKSTRKFIEDVASPSFRVAYVVFKKVSELDKALKLKCLHPLNSEEYKIKLGMNKWIEEYNSSVLLPKVLKEKLEEFMKLHDKEANINEKKEKQLEQEDSEGWITVTKRGKVQSFARTEKVENKIMAKEERNKKRKELKNFYTFQIRESKMKHIVALRQKFEEDKKKIAQIKQSRRFKPF